MKISGFYCPPKRRGRTGAVALSSSPAAPRLRSGSKNTQTFAFADQTFVFHFYVISMEWSACCDQKKSTILHSSKKLRRFISDVMGRLIVPYVEADQKTSIEEISTLLDSIERHAIQAVPWPSFNYKPEVSFAIAHHDDCIFLKYFIKEKSIRALHRRTNDPVFQDSCVEFFISFDNDQEYYNLEFNCIGTCLLGYGKGRTARTLVSEEYIQKIRRHAVINSWNEEGTTLNTWELTLAIPLEVFIFHSISSLKDRFCKVNFFKCGDELPEPHFLAWKNIESSSPNFHLPEYFGTMMFICQ